MQQYVDLVNRVLADGEVRDDRTEVVGLAATARGAGGFGSTG